jgi:hypothetical protein
MKGYIGGRIIETPNFTNKFKGTYNKSIRYIEYEKKKKKAMSAFNETDKGKKQNKNKMKDNAEKKPEQSATSSKEKE